MVWIRYVSTYVILLNKTKSKKKSHLINFYIKRGFIYLRNINCETLYLLFLFKAVERKPLLFYCGYEDIYIYTETYSVNIRDCIFISQI